MVVVVPGPVHTTVALKMLDDSSGCHGGCSQKRGRPKISAGAEAALAPERRGANLADLAAWLICGAMTLSLARLAAGHDRMTSSTLDGELAERERASELEPHQPLQTLCWIHHDVCLML